uniref:Spike protein n=1 Tax=Retropinna nidovirus TaxID=3064111 RepID=A0AA50ADF8_9NIDO|nr:MAG: spike protein [Retropinna nidovirus]
MLPLFLGPLVYLCLPLCAAQLCMDCTRIGTHYVVTNRAGAVTFNQSCTASPFMRQACLTKSLEKQMSLPLTPSDTCNSYFYPSVCLGQSAMPQITYWTGSFLQRCDPHQNNPGYDSSNAALSPGNLALIYGQAKSFCGDPFVFTHTVSPLLASIGASYRNINSSYYSNPVGSRMTDGVGGTNFPKWYKNTPRTALMGIGSFHEFAHLNVLTRSLSVPGGVFVDQHGFYSHLVRLLASYLEVATIPIQDVTSKQTCISSSFSGDSTAIYSASPTYYDYGLGIKGIYNFPVIGRTSQSSYPGTPSYYGRNVYNGADANNEYSKMTRAGCVYHRTTTISASSYRSPTTGGPATEICGVFPGVSRFGMYRTGGPQQISFTRVDGTTGLAYNQYPGQWNYHTYFSMVNAGAYASTLYNPMSAEHMFDSGMNTENVGGFLQQPQSPALVVCGTSITVTSVVDPAVGSHSYFSDGATFDVYLPLQFFAAFTPCPTCSVDVLPGLVGPTYPEYATLLPGGSSANGWMRPVRWSELCNGIPNCNYYPATLTSADHISLRYSALATTYNNYVSNLHGCTSYRPDAVQQVLTTGVLNSYTPGVKECFLQNNNISICIFVQPLATRQVVPVTLVSGDGLTTITLAGAYNFTYTTSYSPYGVFPASTVYGTFSATSYQPTYYHYTSLVSGAYSVQGEIISMTELCTTTAVLTVPPATLSPNCPCLKMLSNGMCLCVPTTGQTVPSYKSLLPAMPSVSFPLPNSFSVMSIPITHKPLFVTSSFSAPPTKPQLPNCIAFLCSGSPACLSYLQGSEYFTTCVSLASVYDATMSDYLISVNTLRDNAKSHIAEKPLALQLANVGVVPPVIPPPTPLAYIDPVQVLSKIASSVALNYSTTVQYVNVPSVTQNNYPPGYWYQDPFTPPAAAVGLSLFGNFLGTGTGVLTSKVNSLAAMMSVQKDSINALTTNMDLSLQNQQALFDGQHALLAAFQQTSSVMATAITQAYANDAQLYNGLVQTVANFQSFTADNSRNMATIAGSLQALANSVNQLDAKLKILDTVSARAVLYTAVVGSMISSYQNALTRSRALSERIASCTGNPLMINPVQCFGKEGVVLFTTTTVTHTTTTLSGLLLVPDKTKSLAVTSTFCLASDMYVAKTGYIFFLSEGVILATVLDAYMPLPVSDVNSFIYSECSIPSLDISSYAKRVVLDVSSSGILASSLQDKIVDLSAAVASLNVTSSQYAVNLTNLTTAIHQIGPMSQALSEMVDANLKLRASVAATNASLFYTETSMADLSASFGSGQTIAIVVVVIICLVLVAVLIFVLYMYCSKTKYKPL